MKLARVAITTILLLVLTLALVVMCSKSAEEKAAEITALQHQGALLLRQQAYDEARGVYDQAIKLDPQQMAAYAGRGEAYFRLKQIEQARTDFQRVIERADKLTDKEKNVLAASYYHLALIRLAENNMEGALDYLELSLKTARNPNVYFHQLQDTTTWIAVKQEPRFRALLERYWPAEPAQVGVKPKPVYPKPPPPPGL